MELSQSKVTLFLNVQLHSGVVMVSHRFPDAETILVIPAKIKQMSKQTPENVF